MTANGTDRNIDDLQANGAQDGPNRGFVEPTGDGRYVLKIDGEPIAISDDPTRFERSADFRPTVYPSFYDAVHRAWNAWVEAQAIPTVLRCYGADSDQGPYNADAHDACFGFAGALRVELHAAGITLSNDGNGGTILPGAADRARKAIREGDPNLAVSGETVVGYWLNDEAAHRQRIAESERGLMTEAEFREREGLIEAWSKPDDQPPLFRFFDRIRQIFGRS